MATSSKVSKITKTQIKQATRAYKTGSGKDAAAVLGVSAPTAIRLLREAGVTIRPRGGRKSVRVSAN